MKTGGQRGCGRAWVVASILATCACACTQPILDEHPQSEAQPLVSGTPDDQHQGVVALARTPADPFCTGVAVGGRLVLTAAHCVDEEIAQDLAVYVGVAAPSFDEKIQVLRIQVHPRWDRATGKNDLAILVLAHPAPAPSWTLPPYGAPGPDVQAPLELVAYGQAGPTDQGHVRRTVPAVVMQTQAAAIVASSPDHGMCPGDSGSPAFLVAEGKEVLVGVLSRGGADCGTEASYVRVAAYTPFIEAGVSWAADASRPIGQACLDDVHCATGMCMTAPDDASVTFCTEACSSDEGCPAGMLCDAGDGTQGRCVFAAPTPGASGAPCSEDDDCHSARCGGASGVCTVRCFDEGASCGKSATCVADRRHQGEHSCLTTPSDVRGFTKGCSLGGGTSSSGPLAVLLAALLFRKRRHAKECV